MKIFSLTKTDDIFKAKFYIEDILLKNEKLNKPFEINEFINKYMNITVMTYCYKNNVIPFNIYMFENEQILIHADEENIDILLNKLKSINYDFSLCKEIKKSNISILLEQVDNLDMFIINGVYYI